ncbi:MULTISPECIES: serine hydrolase domain-containing protein [unclassified Microbacterium]|uniref:serine hydrolase domain-containing protein n=1 Tax=unclassified Microbacterium TaxID=2609290 RepID=UPI0006F288E2|nr:MULTISPECIES: serine hydrolase domain-containing protein [unclassified Microbacterium]AOX46030.1 serine hydrolase [Microbacterium sp. BH-3-3-3]KQT75320.1 serine hydrolase [Microbacterium sp. Leaf436]MBD8206763.1 beta-lactamase family protein [Microbacterium sp. CFBP 8801]MBD8509182.1 beta-lactamase family protein [Microbacterium sp. CFBP 8790]
MRGWRRSAAIAIAGASALAVVLSGCTPQASVALDVPAQVDAPLPEATVSELQDAVTTAMAATGSTGAIVGVWAPWSGTWVSGLGTQGPGGAEVTTDLTFRAADVTGAMTCDAVYRLAADGTLSLSDPITQWVSNLPGYEDITLRQLCDGTSGLASYTSVLEGMVLNNPDRAWNPRELMAYGIASPRLNAPGASFGDSATNYLLAGLAVERATGESLAQVISERVAEPLGLDATALPSSAPANPAASSLQGYWSQPSPEGVWNCTDPREFTEMSASYGGAAAGAVTDITDLGHYAQALASGALLPDGDDRFASPVPVGGDQPTWFTASGGAFQAGSLIGQYGWMPGYMVGAFADPRTGMSIAVVLNNSGGNKMTSAWLAWELAAIASKAPAAQGQTAPEAGLPWTSQQMRDGILANAICPQPAA